MPSFQHDPAAESGGTHQIGTIEIPPKSLVDEFGPPGAGEGYKVSGTYTFTDDSGNVYTLHDWKATSLFDDAMEPGDEEFAITPEEFWGNWNPDTLIIGGSHACDVEAFKAWLREVVG